MFESDIVSYTRSFRKKYADVKKMFVSRLSNSVN